MEGGNFARSRLSVAAIHLFDLDFPAADGTLRPLLLSAACYGDTEFSRRGITFWYFDRAREGARRQIRVAGPRETHRQRRTIRIYGDYIRLGNWAVNVYSRNIIQIIEDRSISLWVGDEGKRRPAAARVARRVGVGSRDRNLAAARHHRRAFRRQRAHKEYSVRIHGNCPITRQGSATENLCAMIQSDAGERNDIPVERSARAESRRTADLPFHRAIRAAILDNDSGAAGRGERASDLKDEVATHTLKIECEGSRQLRRGCETIVARGEREAAQIGAGQLCTARGAGQSIVCGSKIGLGLRRHRVGGMDRADQHDPGGKPSDGGAWTDAQVPLDLGGSSIRHRRAGENRERLCRT